MVNIAFRNSHGAVDQIEFIRIQCIVEAFQWNVGRLHCPAVYKVDHTCMIRFSFVI